MARVWTVEAGHLAAAGAGGNDAATETRSKKLSGGAQRARQCDGVPAVAQSIWLELFSRDAIADADDDRGPSAAAGMAYRGQSDAGPVGGTAAGNRHPQVAGREPVAAGAATAGGKPDAGSGRRRS